MKLRTCYVSNSSTSSFIIGVDLSSKGVSCLKLNDEQKRLLQADGFLKGKDLSKDYYLTEFVYSDSHYDAIQAVEHEEYQEGQLNGEPRWEEMYNEYSKGYQSVYLRRDHDNAKQMTISQFVKAYKKAGLPQDVIVRYEADGVKLLYIH